MNNDGGNSEQINKIMMPFQQNGGIMNIGATPFEQGPFGRKVVKPIRGGG